MPETRTFTLGTATIEQLGQSVESFLRTQDGMEVQGVHGSDGYLVQARQVGGQWRQFVGLDKAIQVRITQPEPQLVVVQAGQGKWIDKLGVGVVGVLWVWPLALVAGFGAVSQVKLARDVLNHVQAFLSVHGGR